MYFEKQCFYYILSYIVQLYDKRSKVVKESERAFWRKQDASYMTEESDYETAEGESFVRRHSLSWRSDGIVIDVFT